MKNILTEVKHLFSSFHLLTYYHISELKDSEFSFKQCNGGARVDVYV